MIDLRLANHCRRMRPSSLGRVGLVEADGARRPAIGEGEPVEIVEQAGPGLRRKAHDGERAQMRAAKPRLEAAGQVLVDQDGVEMHRRLGHAHALAAGRDAGMQVGQRLGVIEPFGLGHEAFDQREHAVGAVDEAGEGRAPVGAVASPVLVEPGFGARGILGRRQPEQRQEIPALEMRAFLLELRAALGVDQPRGGVGEIAHRDSGCAGWRCASMKIAQPEPRRRSALLSRAVIATSSAGVAEFEVGPAKPRGALERAVLVEDDALRAPAPPRAGNRRGSATGGDIRRGSSWPRPHATRCCG